MCLVAAVAAAQTLPQPGSGGGGGGGTGTVTSIAITGPSIISWAGSPVTTSGTFTGTLASQAANLFLAGPSSGAATTPTFRAMAVGDLPAASQVKQCVVIVGDPGAASPVLANDNDSPVACPNDTGTNWTITSVGCWADAGSPTVTPILTGGTGTSLLTGALTCGTASWAAGTVNGSPVVKSFSGGATCSSTPCSIDVNLTTAGGTAKYLVVKIAGTLN